MKIRPWPATQVPPPLITNAALEPVLNDGCLVIGRPAFEPFFEDLLFAVSIRRVVTASEHIPNFPTHFNVLKVVVISP